MRDFLESDLEQNFHPQYSYDYIDSPHFQIGDQYLVFQNENYGFQFSIPDKQCAVLTKQSEYFVQDKKQTSTPEIFVYQKREKTQILISKCSKSKYVQNKIGHRRETSQLTTFYKSIIRNIIDQFTQQNPLEEQELILFDQFNRSSSHLNSFKRLFSSQSYQNFEQYRNLRRSKLNQICINELQKKQVIQKIFRNKKMSFQNKIVTIKFLQQLRQKCINPYKLIQWKQDFKN